MSSSVPEGWISTTFDQIFRDIKNGCSFDQNAYKEGVPVTRIETISSEKIDFSKVGWVNTDDDIERFRINKGDILFSHINSLKHIGKTALKVDDRPLYHGMNLLRFQINVDKYSPRYMHNLLSWDVVREDMRKKAKQAINQASLNVQDIKASEYAVPPLPEQQKIAAILSSVDDVIEKTRAQIDKLKDLKTGMMQELLTKGIGNSAFKDSPVGRIPEGWEVCMASEVADEVMVGVVIKPTQYYVDSGVPALRSANVREGGLTMENLKYFSKESNDLLKKSKLRKGDLLTVRTGYPGTTAVVTEDFEGCNCIDVVITRPSERMNSDFFSLWVNSDNGKGQVLKAQGGLAQQHFNVGDMKNLLVAVPPLEEQKSIFNIVDSVTKKVSIAEVRLEQVRRVKKALMQDLLTGKVRVNIDIKENAVA